MKSKKAQRRKVPVAKHSGQQRKLPLSVGDVATNSSALPTGCQVVAVGKRRDGGTRYWCLRHKADATAKYGRPATACRASHIPPITSKDTFDLQLSKYRGGIALWGAVPPVYDTTRQPLDRGIHLHARRTEGAAKELDRTFRAVRIFDDRLPEEGFVVSDLDAIYYMVTSIFEYDMKCVRCSYCGHAHLDRDWFSVHPHRRHLCAGCGRHFSDTETAIGNPICVVRDACGVKTQRPKPSKKMLDIRQSEFPAGIQIWGSNPAFMWTSRLTEEEGIHVHAFCKDDDHPVLDDTYSQVIIDGIKLDALMVRVLMAQSALPHIRNRVVPIDCPSCGQAQFSVGELAFTPLVKHRCRRCGRHIAVRGRLRKTIANPLPAVLTRLADFAPRQPQEHVIDLLPETL